MFNCLNSLVSYPDCANSQTGYYSITEIAGINELFGSNVADLEKYETAQDLFAQMKETSKKYLVDDISKKLMTENLFLFNKALYTDKTSNYVEKFKLPAPANTIVGLRFEYQNWFRCRDQYLHFVIEEITLFFMNTGTVVLQIVDGSQTTTMNIDVVANVKKVISLSFQATTDIVYITYDQSFLNPNNSTLKNAWGWGSETCVAGNYNYGLNASTWYQGLYIQGITRTGFVETQNNETYGLDVRISLRCSNEELICSLKDYLAHSLLLKNAILLFTEACYGSRINYYTIDKEMIKARITELKAEYEAELMNTVQTIRPVLLNSRSSCVHCLRSKISTLIP